MENGIPVAPEGRDSSYALFGDSFSNFNAGKILLVLEGIGGKYMKIYIEVIESILLVLGLKYSIDEDTFIFADNLPEEWDFMEFNIPVLNKSGETVWVNAIVERGMDELGHMVKIIRVRNNPFK